MASSKVDDFVQREALAGLDEIKIKNLPIWRIVRFRTRAKYFSKQGIYRGNTKRNTIQLNLIIKYLCLSIFDFMAIIWRARTKKRTHVYFTFGRLTTYLNHKYCKFTDPLLDISGNTEKSVVFERSLYGVHLTPRYERSRVVYTDSVEFISYLISILYLPIVLISHKIELGKLNVGISDVYGLGKYGKIIVALEISKFFIARKIYCWLFIYIGAKYLICVNRNIHMAQISAAKECNMKALELQHGHTEAATLLYSGVYSNALDPDLFLTFGKRANAKLFVLPEYCVEHIGFAFLESLKNTNPSSDIFGSSDGANVLVVSSPMYGDSVVEIVSRLSDLHSNCKFILRLHPQERLSKKMKNVLERRINISIDSGLDDSIVVCAANDVVIGVMSTVLHEASYLGKAVGLLCYGGLEKQSLIDNFKKIESEADFQNLIETSHVDLSVFSVFDSFEKNKYLKLLGLIK